MPAIAKLEIDTMDWCKERSYSKAGEADTILMCEQWMAKDGRIYFFKLFYAKQPKI